jgi:hypothetical protein
MNDLTLCIGKSSPYLFYRYHGQIYDAICLSKTRFEKEYTTLLTIDSSIITKFTTQPLFFTTSSGYAICCSRMDNDSAELTCVWGKLDKEILTFQELTMVDIFNIKTMKDDKELLRYVLPPFNVNLLLKLRNDLVPAARKLAEDIEKLAQTAKEWNEYDDQPWELVNYNVIDYKIKHNLIIKIEKHPVILSTNKNELLLFYGTHGKVYLSLVRRDLTNGKVYSPVH